MVCLVGQTDPVEQFGDACAGFGRGDSEIVQRKRDVLGGGAPFEEPGGLEDGADAPAGDAQLLRRQCGQVLPVDDDRAGGRGGEQVDALGQGALAGAAGPDDGEDLTGVERKVMPSSTTVRCSPCP